MKSVRYGFTLIELLVVIMIIGILAAMSLSAMNAAKNSASEARTKATIAKINTFIMEKYASYQHRRVPVDLLGIDPKKAAATRLAAIRELQILEMPDAVEDIKSVSGRVSLVNVNNNALHSMYKSVITQSKNTANTSAELLFLIVMSMPGAPESFISGEIGDTDENGLKEFLDGWGRPIQFIRWPGGHIVGSGVVASLQTGDATNDHDPFDERNLDAGAYVVYPLVYSAGADGVAGLMPSQVPAKVTIEGISMPQPAGCTQAGSPGMNSGSGNANDNTAGDNNYHFDNITNHNMND